VCFVEDCWWPYAKRGLDRADVARPGSVGGFHGAAQAQERVARRPACLRLVSLRIAAFLRGAIRSAPLRLLQVRAHPRPALPSSTRRGARLAIPIVDGALGAVVHKKDLIRVVESIAAERTQRGAGRVERPDLP